MEGDTRRSSEQSAVLQSLASASSMAFQMQQQHNAKDIEVIKQKKKTMTKFLEDYKVLSKQLTTIADKISHDVMVPFGPKAFLPGKLRHTNEVLVLLGDNWFVERSAKQATEIINRRIQSCEQTLKRFDDELKTLKNWNDEVEKLRKEMQLVGAVNIVEREEQVTKEAGVRRGTTEEKVKACREKLLAVRKRFAEETENAHPDDVYFKRLDMLEMEEEIKDELLMLQDNMEDENEVDEVSEEEEDEEPDEEADSGTEEKGRESNPKKVTWSEEDSVRQFESESEEEEDKDTLKITFKHTVEQRKKNQLKMAITGSKPVSANASESAASVFNPSDIYQQFVTEVVTPSNSSSSTAEQPKSILKVKKCTTPTSTMMTETMQTEEQPPPYYEQQQQQLLLEKGKQTAISDEVKEREVVVQKAEGQQDQENTTSAVNTHRPVSRFKASRQRQL